MQDRYVGDIGDYAKYSLLRALCEGRKLGVAWYLFPDENSGDGGHIGYLLRPDKWRDADPHTFDALRRIMGDFLHSKQARSVAVIEESGLLGATVFSREMTVPEGCKGGKALATRREAWYARSVRDLRDCEIVFADPDNGLREREKFKASHCKSGKSICEDEALGLAEGSRPVIVYHHNSRHKGGQDDEVGHWLKRLGPGTCAVRWRFISPRTFFILNCDSELRGRAEAWCERWESPERVYFQGHVRSAVTPPDSPTT